MSSCPLGRRGLEWSTVENRRRFIRMPVTAICYTVVDSKVVRARIVNISRGGVLLELSVPVSSLPGVGNRAAVAFDLPRNPLFSPRSLNWKGIILRTMGEPNRPTHVAIQFTRVTIRPRAAILCLKPAPQRVSDRNGAGIHLVTAARQSNQKAGIVGRPRMQHLGA